MDKKFPESGRLSNLCTQIGFFSLKIRKSIRKSWQPCNLWGERSIWCHLGSQGSNLDFLPKVISSMLHMQHRCMCINLRPSIAIINGDNGQLYMGSFGSVSLKKHHWQGMCRFSGSSSLIDISDTVKNAPFKDFHVPNLSLITALLACILSIVLMYTTCSFTMTPISMHVILLI